MAKTVVNDIFTTLIIRNTLLRKSYIIYVGVDELCMFNTLLKDSVLRIILVIHIIRKALVNREKMIAIPIPILGEIMIGDPYQDPYLRNIGIL